MINGYPLDTTNALKHSSIN